jgi:hypothetical protein
MKRVLIAAVIVAISGVVTRAQTSTSSSAEQKSLAAAMGVYVFPSSGQGSSQQSKDEGECYNWAVKNTGMDPFQLAKQAEQQRQQSQAAAQQPAPATEGSGARGAARGAAAGALFGAIGGSAGTGAAVGAAAGFVGGRMRSREANAQAQQQYSASQQKATAEQIESFKKAFSVCLEAKKYMVKY